VGRITSHRRRHIRTFSAASQVVAAMAVVATAAARAAHTVRAHMAGLLPPQVCARATGGAATAGRTCSRARTRASSARLQRGAVPPPQFMAAPSTTPTAVAEAEAVVGTVRTTSLASATSRLRTPEGAAGARARARARPTVAVAGRRLRIGAGADRPLRMIAGTGAEPLGCVSCAPRGLLADGAGSSG
jgi:hypothetical protein